MGREGAISVKYNVQFFFKTVNNAFTTFTQADILNVHSYKRSSLMADNKINQTFQLMLFSSPLGEIIYK